MAHLVVGRNHINVPQDLRRRGAWGVAQSFNITPLHFSHNCRADLYLGNHCEKQANSTINQLTRYKTLHRLVSVFLSLFSVFTKQWFLWTFNTRYTALLIITWFHITTVRWGESGKGLCYFSVVYTFQVLTLSFFLEPQFDPKVLTNTIQRVSIQDKPRK